VLLRTLILLLRRRPALVLCMNPPYLNGCVAWVYGLFFRARFLLDSHTAAFDDPRPKWLAPLHAFLVRRAALSTVTNRELARRVEIMGGAAVVLSDIPYTMPPGTYPVDSERFTICFVCNYAHDEPILEVLEAARQLPDVRFYVTGNDRKATDEMHHLRPENVTLTEMHRLRPENVTLTGYLSNAEYAGLLRAVSAILVLTTRDFTMQRGGSEAISVGRPLLTSDTATLREVFSEAAVYVDNTADAIRNGIEELRRNYEQYARGIHLLAEERGKRWEIAKRKIDQLLS
jgi:glycosyltransferase involved in cell wall biosynthesis